MHSYLLEAAAHVDGEIHACCVTPVIGDSDYPKDREQDRLIAMCCMEDSESKVRVDGWLMALCVH